jgi:hypothetical protein
MLRMDIAEHTARTGAAQRLGEASGAVDRALATLPAAAPTLDAVGRNSANWQIVLAELLRLLKPEALSRWRAFGCASPRRPQEKLRRSANSTASIRPSSMRSSAPRRCAMPPELARLVENRLDGAVAWAHKLQRRLQSLQTRYWQFDREEGVLAAARVTRLVTHPFEPLGYKIEQECKFPDTLVTLLVDNSGSMRAVPIANAALCAELLGRVLERCGVKTEILGFTTRGWRARVQWVAAGRPENAGRVSELLHVVYKSADEPLASRWPVPRPDARLKHAARERRWRSAALGARGHDDPARAPRRPDRNFRLCAAR